MKFLIASDIHEEFYPLKDRILETLLRNSKADAALLAGDIVTKFTNGRLYQHMPIIYIMGNHEYYGGDWGKTRKEFKTFTIELPNVTLLDNSCFKFPKIKIIGTTLWTSFIAPDTKEDHSEYCYRFLNDFRQIDGVTINKWINRHQSAVKFLTKTLESKFDGETIVMTHHAPSIKSNHPDFKHSMLNGGFCVDLEWLIEKYQPDYWIHGHCHSSADYKIGKTRVICNPMGYPFEPNFDFNPSLTIEV